MVGHFSDALAYLSRPPSLFGPVHRWLRTEVIIMVRRQIRTLYVGGRKLLLWWKLPSWSRCHVSTCTTIFVRAIRNLSRTLSSRYVVCGLHHTILHTSKQFRLLINGVGDRRRGERQGFRSEGTMFSSLSRLRESRPFLFDAQE